MAAQSEGGKCKTVQRTTKQPNLYNPPTDNSNPTCCYLDFSSPVLIHIQNSSKNKLPEKKNPQKGNSICNEKRM